MFQFSGLALFRVIHLQCTRLSHSEIFGLMFVCNYPKLIAAYHVLHRLLVPRHPPCALICFKNFYSRLNRLIFPYYLNIDRGSIPKIAFPICQRTLSFHSYTLVYSLTTLRYLWTRTNCRPLPVYLMLLLLYPLLSLQKVEDIGVEPMTPCVQGRCSSQLS